MDISIQISQADVDRLRQAFERRRQDELVQQRITVNASAGQRDSSAQRIWQALAIALTSSQQRSGPGTKVWLLWKKTPCPLSLQQMDQWKPQIGEQVASFLKGWGGIRCYNRIGDYMEHNHRLLFDDGGWEKLRPAIDELAALMAEPGRWDDHAMATERRACKLALSLGLKGVGNKQCRNWLQDARLLRYEVPLDSRVLKFLAPMTSTLPMEQDLLSCEAYYLLIEDAVHALCRQADILPCVADAVMFLSADLET
jgi:hypothetical protein